MKTKEQIMADLLRSKQDSRARGQQMMAGEGYRPPQMSSNLPQTMSPNMINQSAGMRPGRTNVGQGRAAALAAQMRQAQANMSGDPAQGKTVSNGRIYVAPTWSEVLADGVKKGLGGYNAAQAREGLIEIDEEQAAEDAINAEYEAMLLAQQMAREDEENAQAQARWEAERKTKKSNFEKNFVLQQQQANDSRNKRKDVAYYMPTEEGEFEILNMQKDEYGNYYSTSNELMPEAFVEKVLPGLTEVVYGSQNTSKPPTPKELETKEERETAQTQTLITNDVATDLLGQPEQMMAASGPFYDPVKIATDYMAPIFGLEEEQATGMQMTNVSLEAAGPILAKLGINPTDKDLAIAMDASPSRSNEPASMYRWYKTQWMPTLIAKIKQYNPGAKGEEMAAQAQAEMMDAYEKGFAKYNKLKNDPIFTNLRSSRFSEQVGWELVP